MVGTRRRGRALESALLDAAWAELTERGYPHMTMAGVADRAGAAKSVLYRRWPDKAALVLALVEERVPRLGVTAPTGDLRGDVVAVLERMRAAYDGMAILGELDPALNRRLRGAADDSALAQITDALRVADIDPGRICPRVLRVPVDLLARDLSGDGRADIAVIVDEVFLPLVRMGAQT